MQAPDQQLAFALDIQTSATLTLLLHKHTFDVQREFTYGFAEVSRSGLPSGRW